MLRELHISNLAVIEDASIELAEGLNCFTGQTGAGKSLVIGAFEVLLGLRSAGDLLRTGAEQGRVSGVFELADRRIVERINEAADLSLDPARRPEQLLITRKLFASGRTSVSINGQPATLGMLETIGEQLVDVHGQHDHQLLLKPAHQLLMLDEFGECDDLRRQFTRLHRRLGGLRERKTGLAASAKLRRQQLDLYEFQAGEIDEADPTPGEFEEVSARHRVLSNLGRIHRESAAAHAALYESDGAIAERLQAVIGVLGSLSELDDQIKQIVADLRTAAAQLQDASFTLNRYLNRLDLDPAELEETEHRLNTLNRLIHKYGHETDGATGTLDDVIAYRQHIEGEMTALRSQREDLASIDAQIEPMERALRELGESLTVQRQAAAKKLGPLVEAELAELGMGEAKFDVAFETVEYHASGGDEVEMLVQANPGQAALPLRKVASGGELSRIMLALKGIVASADRVSVLVFDEIDANVGGRMGTVIGRKLGDLAAHHQVLCITHLPQIAAFAGRHLKIAKQVTHGQTHTTVSTVEGDGRIEELAEMLTGKNATGTTRKQAEELLALAQPSARRRKRKSA